MSAIQKVSYTHEAMIDLLVAHPGISQGELASHFGYTPAWISTIMSSDAFKEQLAARREELVDPILRVTMEDRFNAVVTRSLEVLQEKLEQPHNAVPDQLVLQAAALGARALGKGGFGGSGAAVQVNVQVNAEERLARVAGRLSSLVRERRGEGNAEIVEVGGLG